MSSSKSGIALFLKRNISKSNDEITHTRIGDSKFNILGGKYTILENQHNLFYQNYCNFLNDPYHENSEYLTEKQLEKGPLAVDLDFRYKYDHGGNNIRRYTSADILDFIEILLQSILGILDVSSDFPVFIFEKEEINIVNSKNPPLVKDGVHIIVGINCDSNQKIMIRNRLLSYLTNIWTDLWNFLDNNSDNIVDNGIFIGKTNWQLYGSCKPKHKAYVLKRYFVSNKELEITEKSIDYFINNEDKTLILKTFPQLCIRYSQHPTGILKSEYEKEYQSFSQPKKKIKLSALSSSENNSVSVPIDFKSIRCLKDINAAVTRIIGNDENRTTEQWSKKENHDYTMMLPKDYYAEGSYDKWIRVGWALRNSGFDYFPIWLKFSNQWKGFKFSDVPSLFNDWCSWDVRNISKSKALTGASIRYWAKLHDIQKYNIIKKNSLNHLVDECINDSSSGADYDLAKILHHLYKDDFVCASIKGNVWYEYIQQRWCEIDSGQTIRTKLSTEVYDVFKRKLEPLRKQLGEINPSEEEQSTKKRKQIARTIELAMGLKKTNNKKNILREACDLFYVKDFLSLLDSKDHILCFNNGVIDFQEGKFRPGRHDDYTSKSTGIDYIPIDYDRDSATLDQINEFWKQLFPKDELRQYMIDHAASVLLGRNNNQTFNIYTGAGRNGKSKFVELMSLALGEYKATVPVSLVTAKRNGIGSLSPEIMQLRGTRFAVMQEPSKGDKINEGVMKELTGGDPIQCRALYKDAVTFIPTFKLAVCTNNLFDIKSNDDGTWRRIRVCPFESLFTENPVDNDPRRPYQFKVDKYIDAKFESWKVVFMAQLVQRAMETQGEVKDCKTVLSESEHYRADQDCFAEFARDCIVTSESGVLGVDTLHDAFKEWWCRYQGGSPPKGKELFQYINREFGQKGKDKKWHGITLYIDFNEDEEDVFN